MIIKVKAKPSSRKREILKINEDSFEVSLREKAEDNKANIELIKLLSNHFEVPNKNIKILKGMTSRHKIIQIEK